jgi:phospholipid-binding lipoprotein MlaA
MLDNHERDCNAQACVKRAPQSLRYTLRHYLHAGHMNRLSALLLLAAICSGCATGPNKQDPYESANRKVHAFNQSLDSAILKPVATGYVKVLPSIARTGVSNFYRNLGMIVTSLNNALQFKLEKVPVDFMRFTTNIFLGLGGLYDMATDLGIPYNKEDFGQTLGYWGVSSGPYVVLPFFGPSNVRDGLALPVDIYVSPVYDAVGDDGLRWGLLILYAIDTRSNLFEAEKFMRESALDEYSFVRDTYLQRREYLIRDGVAPPAGDAETTNRPKTLRELEEEEFGDDAILDDDEDDN